VRWHATCIPLYNRSMLDDASLRSRLPVGEFGRPLYVFTSIGSTNDQAEELARQGAPHGTLVVSDAQTAGRGRGSSAWLTPPGSGLAMSLILRPIALAPERAWGLNVLGALAILDGLEREGIRAQIKWPNDVLAGGCKLAGVLAEATWDGERLDHAVLGMGVNVGVESVPGAAVVDFPATCVEEIAGREVDRSGLLLGILNGLLRWYPRIGSAAMLEAWDRSLAFRGETVDVEDGRGVKRGTLQGLTPDGRIELIDTDRQRVVVEAGAWRLRPVAPRP
jgi:BirA family biotin operon repressor/biotin-[acetyl-CoA-carboxylase] ligase